MSFTFSIAAAISVRIRSIFAPHVSHQRVGVLRFGEEADIVFPAARFPAPSAAPYYKGVRVPTAGAGRPEALAATPCRGNVHRPIALRAAQRIEHRIDHRRITFLDGVFLLDGHGPDFAAALEFADDLESARSDVGRSHLVEQSEFFLQILLVLAVDVENVWYTLEKNLSRATRNRFKQHPA